MGVHSLQFLQPVLANGLAGAPPSLWNCRGPAQRRLDRAALKAVGVVLAFTAVPALLQFQS